MTDGVDRSIGAAPLQAPSTARVVWTQGLFLQPQHFQQQERYLESLLDRRVRAAAPYAWGFLSLQLDDAALELGTVAVVEARGVLPDGTSFSIPQLDPPPEPLRFDDASHGETVHLVAMVRGAEPVEMRFAETPGARSDTRYAVVEAEVADHVLGSPPVVMQLGRVAFRLVRSADVGGGHAALAVARIAERTPNGRLVTDAAHIPSMLSTRANATLQAVARELLGTLRQRGDSMASVIGQPGRGGLGEIVDYLYLQTVNRHEPVFSQLARDAQLHPARLHEACLALAGDLACFASQTKRASEYPAYRHDDLEGTFRALASDLRRMLAWEPDRQAVPIELQDRRHGYRIGLIPDARLATECEFVLAVSAQIPQKQLIAAFPDESKAAPIERIQELVQFNLPGIPLVPLAAAPRQLPFLAGFAYFRLDGTASGMWDEIARAGGLALHVPDKYPGMRLELWAIRN